jgi:hypothetical protein
VEAYFARDIEKDLALGRSQLVALAMLLGGDYTDGGKFFFSRALNQFDRLTMVSLLYQFSIL